MSTSGLGKAILNQIKKQTTRRRTPSTITYTKHYAPIRGCKHPRRAKINNYLAQACCSGFVFSKGESATGQFRRQRSPIRNANSCSSDTNNNLVVKRWKESTYFGDAARRFDEMLISEFDAETKKVFSCDAACRVTQNKRQAVELRLVRHHEHPVLNYHDDSHFKGKRFNFRTMQQTVHEVHAKNEVTGNGHRP